MLKRGHTARLTLSWLPPLGGRKTQSAARNRRSLRKTVLIQVPQHPPPTNELSESATTVLLRSLRSLETPANRAVKEGFASRIGALKEATDEEHDSSAGRGDS